MTTTSDLFTGINFLQSAFLDSYTSDIIETIIEDIILTCFEKTEAYDLQNKFNATQEEYKYARHLADIDILNQFCIAYVINHRNFKYSPGKSDTASHVVQVLAEKGIYISCAKYNNWRRDKTYRLIDSDTLELLLELLKITPSEFKRLIYAHIAVQREINKNPSFSGDNLSTSCSFNDKNSLFIRIKPVRPPCYLVA